MIMHSTPHITMVRLPLEILQQVFLISSVDDPPMPCHHLGVFEPEELASLTKDERHHAISSGRKFPPIILRKREYCCLGWLSVTHVCCNWRNAALAYPRLWTTPAFQAGIKWAEAMLLRSRNAPLHLDLYRAPDSFPLRTTFPNASLVR
ncbi:hypothetical protein BC834DRAFT_642334 [Gloeopeniophorella convolvens]|nr:hypothetical protein BC834DRAFT_642334 [Gloeopeniophorella convolvens]